MSDTGNSQLGDVTLLSSTSPAVSAQSPPREEPGSHVPKQRVRTGCRTCRLRKVKCDETKPNCRRCTSSHRSCEWPQPGSSRRRASSRRPNLTACEACREQKLRCIGGVHEACQKCRDRGIHCIRPRASPSAITVASSRGAASDTPEVALVQPDSDRAAELPTGSRLDELIQLYFSSVHNYGFFAFIHEPHFKRLLAKRRAPRELTLMMIASALRFAAEPSPENLHQADTWANVAITTLLGRIYQGFGAIQLMALLLAQHYDLNRGSFSSAWLLGANCTRMMQMMSLHTFDRTYAGRLSSNQRLSPLLTSEALRRVAWADFYLDTIIDGGRYGFHTIEDTAYRLQLPCNEACFLGDEPVATEPLVPQPDEPTRATFTPRDVRRGELGIHAYLLRTAAVRRHALHFAFRASHKEQTVEKLSDELRALEVETNEIINGLPRRFHFSNENVFMYRDSLVTFILLHVLRHNLFIVLGRAALLLYQRDVSRHGDLIAAVRRKRVLHAKPIAGLVSEGLKAGISLDPQLGVHAYVALEILLFETRRLAKIDSSIDPQAAEFVEAIPPLLTTIREIARRSEFVKQLYVEAVHRLLRCDCISLLKEEDLAAFKSEYRLISNDEAEYDFRDFRWAKLERLRRGGGLSASAAARDEALLEYKAGGDTAASSAPASPRLDAMDVSKVNSDTDAGPWLGLPAAQQLPPTANPLQGGGLSILTQNVPVQDALRPDQNPLWGPFESVDENAGSLPMELPLLFGDLGYGPYQTGDPDLFWSQLGLDSYAGS